MPTEHPCALCGGPCSRAVAGKAFKKKEFYCEEATEAITDFHGGLAARQKKRFHPECYKRWVKMYKFDVPEEKQQVAQQWVMERTNLDKRKYGDLKNNAGETIVPGSANSALNDDRHCQNPHGFKYDPAYGVALNCSKCFAQFLAFWYIILAYPSAAAVYLVQQLARLCISFAEISAQDWKFLLGIMSSMPHYRPLVVRPFKFKAQICYFMDRYKDEYVDEYDGKGKKKSKRVFICGISKFAQDMTLKTPQQLAKMSIDNFTKAILDKTGSGQIEGLGEFRRLQFCAGLASFFFKPNPSAQPKVLYNTRTECTPHINARGEDLPGGWQAAINLLEDSLGAFWIEQGWIIPTGGSRTTCGWEFKTYKMNKSAGADVRKQMQELLRVLLKSWGRNRPSALRAMYAHSSLPADYAPLSVLFLLTRMRRNFAENSRKRDDKELQESHKRAIDKILSKYVLALPAAQLKNEDKNKNESKSKEEEDADSSSENGEEESTDEEEESSDCSEDEKEESTDDDGSSEEQSEEDDDMGARVPEKAMKRALPKSPAPSMKKQKKSPPAPLPPVRQGHLLPMKTMKKKQGAKGKRKEKATAAASKKGKGKASASASKKSAAASAPKKGKGKVSASASKKSAVVSASKKTNSKTGKGKDKK